MADDSSSFNTHVGSTDLSLPRLVHHLSELLAGLSISSPRSSQDTSLSKTTEQDSVVTKHVQETKHPIVCVQVTTNSATSPQMPQHRHSAQRMSAEMTSEHLKPRTTPTLSQQCVFSFLVNSPANLQPCCPPSFRYKQPGQPPPLLCEMGFQFLNVEHTFFPPISLPKCRRDKKEEATHKQQLKTLFLYLTIPFCSFQNLHRRARTSTLSLFFTLFAFTPTMSNTLNTHSSLHTMQNTPQNTPPPTTPSDMIGIQSPGPKQLDLASLELCFAKALSLPGTRVAHSSIPGSLVNRILKDSKFVLAVRFAADPKSSISRLKELILHIWGTRFPVDIHFVGKPENAKVTFLAIFMEEEDMIMVTRKQPWNVNGILLLIENYNALSDINELSFSRGIVWVQVFGLPPLINKCKLFILEAVSVAGDADPDSYKNFDSFARIKVYIDLCKPLVTGNVLNVPGFGKKTVIFRYEKAWPLCFRCAKVGHLQASCSTVEAMHNPDGAFEFLRAPPSSSLLAAKNSIQPRAKAIAKRFGLSPEKELISFGGESGRITGEAAHVAVEDSSNGIRAVGTQTVSEKEFRAVGIKTVEISEFQEESAHVVAKMAAPISDAMLVDPPPIINTNLTLTLSPSGPPPLIAKPNLPTAEVVTSKAHHSITNLQTHHSPPLEPYNSRPSGSGLNLQATTAQPLRRILPKTQGRVQGPPKCWQYVPIGIGSPSPTRPNSITSAYSPSPLANPINPLHTPRFPLNRSFIPLVSPQSATISPSLSEPITVDSKSLTGDAVSAASPASSEPSYASYSPTPSSPATNPFSVSGFIRKSPAMRAPASSPEMRNFYLGSRFTKAKSSTSKKLIFSLEDGESPIMETAVNRKDYELQEHAGETGELATTSTNEGATSDQKRTLTKDTVEKNQPMQKRLKQGLSEQA